MDLATFQKLLSPTGQQALQAAEALAPRENDFLRHLTGLTRQYPRELAEAALETAILRLEAVGKFPNAGPHVLHPPGAGAGFDRLLDLGCSVGGDTLSLAELAPTLGIDLDPLRLAMAQANIEGVFYEIQDTGRNIERSLTKTGVGLYTRVLAKMTSHLL